MVKHIYTGMTLKGHFPKSSAITHGKPYEVLGKRGEMVMIVNDEDICKWYSRWNFTT